MADFDQRDQKVETQYNADTLTINHSVPPEVIDDLRNTLHLKDKVISRLLHTLDEKAVALEDRESKLRDMAQQYTEIEARLAKRDETDSLAKRAKEKLDEGDLEGAEALLNQSLEQNLKQITERKKAAAADAFELAKIRELHLDYRGALPFYEQAVELAPDDSLYLNDLGVLLHTLGETDQAITFYNQALAIDLKVLGDQHPNVAIRYNNLGSAWQGKGDVEQAITFFKKALPILQSKLGDDHPNTKTVRDNIETLKKKR